MATTPNQMPRNNGSSEFYAALEAAQAVWAEAWERLLRYAADFTAAMESIQAAHDDATDPRVNPCPECPEGEQTPTAFGSLGATAWECSAGCGWRESH